MLNTSSKIIMGVIGTVIAVVLGLLFYTFIFPKNTPLGPISPMPKEITATSESISDSFSSNRSLKPLATNQWYSSLLFDFPTQPLYALPIAYKLSSSGVSFSYPDIKKTPDTIFAPFVEDFTIGLDTELTKPTIQSIGDFSIGLAMVSKKNNTLGFTIGHGIPFTVLHTDAQTISISIPNGYQIYADNKNIPLATSSAILQTLVLTTRNHNYIVSFSGCASSPPLPALSSRRGMDDFLSPGERIKGEGKNSSIPSDCERNVSITKSGIFVTNPQRIFVGLLPSRDNYTDFKNIMDTEVTDTTVSPEIINGAISTTYHLITTKKNSLIALYPHQFDFETDTQSSLGTYQTLRGPLSLIHSNSFTTKIPAITPPDSFVKLKKNKADLTQQIKTDIGDVIKNKQPDSEDYFLGTWLGKVDNLLLLADTFGLPTEKKQLLQFVEPIYVNSLNNFIYDKTMTSLISKKPEFGNEKNNDHHFHYGYFIRTAAVLAKFDPTIVGKIKPQVTQMVTDIANTNRQSDFYPFLRHFDMYEGHSWADGKAGFADGNNQESSSEAMNAWYGVYLWSRTIHDQNVEQYALYLYNTEMQSTYYYWFDIKNIYSTPYTHAMASIIWGGKVDFSTWFSAETNMKYGIQLLPFTPASDYLEKLPNFAKYDKDYHANGGNETKDWGDMFTMWKSYYSPTDALALVDAVGKLEGDNTRSMFLYELYKNAENGK